MKMASINHMNNYSFTITWSDEDEGYIAVCPEFPGQSAFGETVGESLTELKIALDLAVEIYQQEGWPIPEPRKLSVYSGQFRIRMPKFLHAKLAEQAEVEGVSLNTLVVTYLSEAVGMTNAAPKKAAANSHDNAKNKVARTKAEAS